MRLFSAFLFTLGFLLALCASADSDYLEQVRALSPSDAQIQEVLPNSRESILIDHALLKIFSTPTGKSFCATSTENFNSFKNSFFINSERAQQAFSSCHGHFSQTQIKFRFQKRYYMVSSERGSFPANGWTTSANETYLFFQEGDLREDRLIRTLSHELAVSLDRKEQIGFAENIDFSSLGILETKDAKASLPFLRRTSIKHSFSALRAFEVEAQIAQELNLQLPPGLIALKNLTCEQKLNFITPYLRSFEKALQDEQFVNMVFDEANNENHTDDTNIFKGAAHTLSQLQFTFMNGETKNVCDYMSQGIPFFAGVSMRGGPGPRIGGTGWKTLEGISIRNDELEKSSLKLKQIPELKNISIDISVKNIPQQSGKPVYELKRGQ